MGLTRDLIISSCHDKQLSDGPLFVLVCEKLELVILREGATPIHVVCDNSEVRKTIDAIIKNGIKEEDEIFINLEVRKKV